MHSLLALLGVFFSTAILYLIGGLSFVGVVFLIVYVGAVAVLFLFVIMLLNVKSLTSKDPLIQHLSQIMAIIFAVLLLAQIFFTLGGASDHLLAVNFLLDSIIEPTTGEAVSLFVRFLSRDINGLTGLYTTHGLMFLLTTAILLVALLGAIILATVTTERATSISDLRPYTARAQSPTVLLLPIAIVFLHHGLVVDYLVDCDLDPIFFSHYLRGAERDEQLRSSRERTQDAYAVQSYRMSTTRYKRRAYRNPLRATVKHFLVDVPKDAAEVEKQRRARAIWRARGAYRWQRAKRRARVGNRYVKRYRRVFSTVYAGVRFARAALAPLLKRRYRASEKVLIVRHRWLWRWRRNRAAWLRRLLIVRERVIVGDSYDSHTGKVIPYPR